MEIAAFKVKSCILPVLTFNHSYLNILSHRSPFNANSILLDSWLEDILTYHISAKNELIWEIYDFYKMTYKFYQQTCFVKKQQPGHPSLIPLAKADQTFVPIIHIGCH